MRTLRIHNLDRARRSVSVNLMLPGRGAPARLRRGQMITPLYIAAAGHLDVCSFLGGILNHDVSAEEANRILDASPEFRAFERSKRLERRIFDPQATAQEGAAKAAALEARRLAAPEPAPAPALAPHADEAPEAPEAAPALANEAAEVAEVVEVAAGQGEPSMEWSHGQLVRYMREHNITLPKSRSKTQLLKAIRRAEVA